MNVLTKINQPFCLRRESDQVSDYNERTFSVSIEKLLSFIWEAFELYLRSFGFSLETSFELHVRLEVDVILLIFGLLISYDDTFHF